MLRDIRDICALTRWCTSPKIMAAARLIVKRIKVPGITDLKIIPAPANGTSCYGGWRMPLCWNVKQARLTLLGNKTPDVVLADYKVSPLSLMMYSPGTVKGGITAEVSPQFIDLIHHEDGVFAPGGAETLDDLPW